MPFDHASTEIRARYERRYAGGGLEVLREFGKVSEKVR